MASQTIANSIGTIGLQSIITQNGGDPNTTQGILKYHHNEHTRSFFDVTLPSGRTCTVSVRNDCVHLTVAQLHAAILEEESKPELRNPMDKC